MSYLIFDTETSSLPSKSLPATDPKQARILQLACLYADEEFKEIGSFCSLIKPSTDFEIHPKAFAAHGITRAQCMKYGIPVEHALNVFSWMLFNAKTILGFNLSFDKQLINIEADLQSTSQWSFDPAKTEFCVMKAMTPICKLPAAWKGTEYKWPTLQEAYKHCFGVKFEKAHDALADVRATASVYRWYMENHKEIEHQEAVAQ